VARIAIVCEPPDGGVAQHVRQLALGLPAHGYEPVLLVPREFAHLEELRDVCEVLTLRRDYGHPQDDVRALAGIVPAARKAALVHSHSAKAGVLGRVAAVLARRPAVYTPHGFPFVGTMSQARRRFGVVVERALAPVTNLICVCEFERGLATAHKLRSRRAAVVHNGCPACPDVPQAALPEGAIVGAVSTFRPAKALDVLIDAMRMVDARLVLAGEGPLEAELRERAAGLDVTFLPYEAPPARYLRGFDVYVLSSRWEAFPIGPLEAMACGVPQVVTAVGGTRESVVPETGIVVAPDDPAALAEAINALLNDPPRRAEMSAASRERHAARFTVERMVAGTAAVYDAVLAGGRGRG
jgi:glycosyltransferase involved in cell wall biosynthesis